MMQDTFGPPALVALAGWIGIVLHDNTEAFPLELLEAAQKLHDEAFLVPPLTSCILSAN